MKAFVGAPPPRPALVAPAPPAYQRWTAGPAARTLTGPTHPPAHAPLTRLYPPGLTLPESRAVDPILHIATAEICEDALLQDSTTLDPAVLDALAALDASSWNMGPATSAASKACRGWRRLRCPKGVTVALRSAQLYLGSDRHEVKHALDVLISPLLHMESRDVVVDIAIGIFRGNGLLT